MKTALITLKTDPKTKLEAKKVASNLGLSLSSLLNGLLLNVVNTGEVRFSQKPEIPNDDTARAIKESEDDYKAGRFHCFANVNDFIAHLNKV
jgi:addiction module RelB/DinJ family antitoxin